MKGRRVPAPLVLLVDDEESILDTLGAALVDEGFRVVCVKSGEEALSLSEQLLPDVVLLDIWLPGEDGLSVLSKLKERNPDLAVVMISGHGTVETAVKATKLGAFDFLEKPLNLDKVLLTLNHILELSKLRDDYKKLKEEMFGEEELLGKSAKIEEIRQTILKVAPTEAWVLIRGENGTGKEVVARMIHRLSQRKENRFVDLNCAAIPDELIESELFGYEKGAFTGAERRKPGKLELANGGTLFLDEIGDMSLKTQAKLLRALQEQSFQRVGGTEEIKVDVRVITATNQDLENAIKEGRFREDLYYRLNVVPIEIPPLRERSEDIPIFVEHFLNYFSIKSGLAKKPIQPEVMKALSSYSWPGNVRELKNIIERMVILSRGHELTIEDLPVSIGGGKGYMKERPYEKKELKDALREFEKEFILRRLLENNYDVSETAKVMGLDRTTLYRKIKQYQISLEHGQRDEQN